MSFTQRLQKPAALHLMAAPVTEASVLFEERQKEQVDCGGWTAAPKARALRSAWHGYTGPHTTWEMAPSGGTVHWGLWRASVLVTFAYPCLKHPEGQMGRERFTRYPGPRSLHCRLWGHGETEHSDGKVQRCRAWYLIAVRKLRGWVGLGPRVTSKSKPLNPPVTHFLQRHPTS